MLRRLLSRRTLKWTGTIACILLAAVFAGSRWYAASSRFVVGAHGVDWGVTRGFVWVYDVDLSHSLGYWQHLKQLGTTLERVDAPEIVLWPKRSIPVLPERTFNWWGSVPLWIPLILLAIPTALLWRLDRRRPLPNHCRNCNYNLTANTSGRCPECGASVPPANSALLQPQPPV